MRRPRVAPGAAQDVGPGRRYGHIKEVLREMQRAENAGDNHMLWVEWQRRYCGEGRSTANICIPVISFTPENQRPPVLANKILLSHPGDCERIARTHVQKMPDQAGVAVAAVRSPRCGRRCVAPRPRCRYLANLARFAIRL